MYKVEKKKYQKPAFVEVKLSGKSILYTGSEEPATEPSSFFPENNSPSLGPNLHDVEVS